MNLENILKVIALILDILTIGLTWYLRKQISKPKGEDNEKTFKNEK